MAGAQQRAVSRFSLRDWGGIKSSRLVPRETMVLFGLVVRMMIRNAALRSGS